MRIWSFLVIILLVYSPTCQKFIKKTLQNVGNSICLNGEPGFFYLNQNYSRYADKVMIHFMATPSAKFCGNSSLLSSLQSCLQLQTQISLFWTSSLTLDNIIFDELDSEKWIKIIIPHCDGGIFQGLASQSTKYKNKDLYFRGNSIVRNIFGQLNKMIGFDNSDVVLSGSGIGSMGALIWSKYFSQTFFSRKFKLVLDSIPKNYPSIKSGNRVLKQAIRNLLNIANIDEPNPFSSCALRRQGKEQGCFFLDYNYNYLDFPSLVIESQYDYYSIEKSLEINCVDSRGSLSGCSQDQRNFIQKYRSEDLVTLFRFANSQVGVSDQNAIWSVSCYGGNFLLNANWKQFRVENKTSYQSFLDFSYDQRPIFYDKYAWPSNNVCSMI